MVSYPAQRSMIPRSAPVKFLFFEPSRKVQKDRKIMRETDSRLAKYSRRGLILTVLAFALSLLLGEFFETATKLSIVLASVLCVLTLIRGYLLFGFELLYPKAPSRWRNVYFWVSVVGAAWWSTILSSITWVVGFQAETHFLWLYTIVFYASICNVFAPYPRFLATYLFLGQIPVAIASFCLLTVDGLLYGSAMLILHVMLRKQGEMVSKNYWERLDAHYALQHRAHALEMEKRDSEAAAALNHNFLVALSDEFRTSLNDIVGALSVLSHDEQLTNKHKKLLHIAEKASDRQLQAVTSVMDYSKIKAGKLVLERTVFNLPKLMDSLINDKEPDAEATGKEFILHYDESVPVRVRGDSIRLAQLVYALLDQAIAVCTGSELTVSVKLVSDNQGQTHLSVQLTDDGDRALPHANDSGASQPSHFMLSMNKHLADAMGGDITLEEEGESVRLGLQLTIEPISSTSFLKQYPQTFSGQVILLVHFPPKIELEALEVMSQWRLKPVLVKQGEDVQEALDRQQQLQQPASLAVVFSRKDSLTAIPTSQRIAAKSDVAQIMVISQLQVSSRILQQHLQQTPNVRIVQKPVTQDKMFRALNEQFKVDATQAKAEKGAILLIEDNPVDQEVLSKTLESLQFRVHLVTEPTAAMDHIEQEDCDLILLSCHLNGSVECDESFALAGDIQHRQQAHAKRIPLLGMTTSKSDDHDRQCLTSGMDDTLVKPIRKEELRKRINHWLVES